MGEWLSRRLAFAEEGGDRSGATCITKIANANSSKQNCSKTSEKTVELQQCRKLGGSFPEFVRSS